jgi:hypothetical protein
MEFGVSPPCSVRRSRSQRAGQNRQPFLNRTGQSERLGQQAVEPRLMVAPSRRLRCRKALADPLHSGLALPTLCRGPSQLTTPSARRSSADAYNLSIGFTLATVN